MQTAEQLNFRLYVIKQILVPAHSLVQDVKVPIL